MENSIVIPAHNEQERLGATLTEYTLALQNAFGDEVEVLVVANGCTDRTAEVAFGYARSCPQVRVIDIAAPIGKGGAVLEGFRQARGRRIAFVDADGATAPASVLELLSALQRWDIAIGSRWMKGSVIGHAQPAQRRIFSRLFNASVHSLFGLPYRDTQCGAKAFRRAAALELAGVVQEPNWTFDVDMLLWARFFGFSVTEMPVTWNDKKGSTLKTTSTMREVALALWRLKSRDMGSLAQNRPVYRREEVQV